MIFGAQLGSFKGLTLKQALNTYINLSEEFNLDAVELSFEKGTNHPSLWPWETEFQEEITDFLKKFKITGAHLSFIYLNPIALNPRIRKESINQLKIGIEKAAELGMDYATMHARGWAYDLSKDQEWSRWVEVFTELARCAEDHSIILTIENGEFSLSDIVNMVQEINSESLKITLDIGHAHFRKRTSFIWHYALSALDRLTKSFIIKKNMPYEQYGSIQNFLKSEYNSVFSLHIHDYNGRKDHITIGNGNIDFSFLSYLKRKKFSGPLILETTFINHYNDFKRNYERLLAIINGGL